MKIAVCQSDIKFLDYEYNISEAKKAVSFAAENNADIILFPEMSFTGFSMNTQITSKYASSSLEAVIKMAVKNHIHIGFGRTEKHGNSLAENHYSIISHDGEILLDYVKIHPFSYAGEDKYFRGGTSLPSVNINNTVIRCVICYDLRFPELFRINNENIDAVIVPANWPAKRADHWKSLLKARAIENQAYVIGINCTGYQEELKYSGGSCIIAPDGSYILSCGNEPGIYFAQIDADKISEQRKIFPVLKDIRKDLYNKL